MLARTSCIIALLLWSVALLAYPASAQEEPDIIILFDQSGSVGKHDPKLASKAWLLTFLKTFKNPYKIEIVGFDEDLHRHLAVDRESATDVTSVNRAIDGIAMVGLATNLEMPFRYLLDRAKSSTKLAVIISDGEPEIWDAKLGYLSKEVQRDVRYDDLKRQYQNMIAAGASKKKQFESLGTLYHTRNIDLIEAQMPGVSKVIGGRLIIWDLSGTSYYLKTWAKAAGAHYLPLRVAAQENPVEQLQKAMTALQEHSSAIVKEALPADHERRADVALTAIPEIAAKVQPRAEPTARPASSPADMKAPNQLEPQAVSPPVAMGEKTSSLPILLLLLAGAAGGYFFIRRRATVSPVKAEADVPLDIASHYIDAKVKKALEDAESLRRKLLINESSAVSVERRFSLRVVVPPGAMDVHWIAQSGQPAQSPAIDISMQSVKFAAGEAEVKAVTRIICPKMGVELGVVQSKINRQEAQHAVATLVEFDNNLDDWMCWVEIITRIDQKSAEA